MKEKRPGLRRNKDHWLEKYSNNKADFPELIKVIQKDGRRYRIMDEWLWREVIEID
jgi:hypothetical protein